MKRAYDRRKRLKQGKRKEEKNNSSKIANQRNGHRLVLCHPFGVCISHGKFDYTAATNSPHIFGAK